VGPFRLETRLQVADPLHQRQELRRPDSDVGNTVADHDDVAATGLTLQVGEELGTPRCGAPAVRG
jgi:hypothetical protein